MGYYTEFRITVKESKTTKLTTEQVSKKVQELSQIGDEASLLEISKLLGNKEKPVIELIVDKLNEITDYTFDNISDNEIISNNGSIKWYDSIEDLTEVSKAFPDVLLQVDGEGEESGDIWRTYYKGGKSQCANAKIVYEDYDESKLM